MMKANRKLRRVARRLFRLCRVDGRLDAERVRLVAQRVAGSGRRGALAILRDLLRLVRLDRDGHRAIVESATPLPEDLRIDVQTSVTRAYGQEVDTSFVVNPQLIGGMRIRVGSHVYDASVRAKLAALEARL
jgi:F-type H+-transporting ATPase subunit delta